MGKNRKKDKNRSLKRGKRKKGKIQRAEKRKKRARMRKEGKFFLKKIFKKPASVSGMGGKSMIWQNILPFITENDK